MPPRCHTTPGRHTHQLDHSAQPLTRITTWSFSSRPPESGIRTGCSTIRGSWSGVAGDRISGPRPDHRAGGGPWPASPPRPGPGVPCRGGRRVHACPAQRAACSLVTLQTAATGWGIPHPQGSAPAATCRCPAIRRRRRTQGPAQDGCEPAGNRLVLEAVDPYIDRHALSTVITAEPRQRRAPATFLNGWEGPTAARVSGVGKPLPRRNGWIGARKFR
jgi:hypothetical protein